MITKNGRAYILKPHPTVPAYHYVEIPTELRAWVENPFFPDDPSEPVYLLCEILETDRNAKIATVRTIDKNQWTYPAKYETIHNVHLYAPSIGKVTKDFGRPQ